MSNGKLVHRGRAPLALAATLAAVAIAACGGGDDESDDAPPAESASLEELGRYLPSGAPGAVYYADVAAAREELGLPADAEALPFDVAFDEDTETSAPEYKLLDAVNPALAPLSYDLRKFELDPVTEAFDDTAISAAISGGSEAAVTALKTSQSFDDLAGALEAEGYVRDGDVLSGPHPQIKEVADAGDGVVLIANQEGAAADAAAEPPGGPADSLDLVAGADQPIAQAIGGIDSDCVVSYGGWENAGGSEGTIALEVDGDAQAEKLDSQAIAEATGGEVGEPTVNGSTVEVPFTTDGDERAQAVRNFMAATFGAVYDCG